MGELDRRTEDIIAYFDRLFGAVDPKTLQEVASASATSNEVPIAIHRIPPSADRDSTILFTTSLGTEADRENSDAAGYRDAELFIELPGAWPLSLEDLTDPNHRWPINWLRRVAAYTRREEAGLGGPIAIVENSHPPSPLAPDCPFTAVLFAAGYEGVGPIELSGGGSVAVYTLAPLYEDEVSLEKTEGLRELFSRFDRLGISRRVSLDRPNVGLMPATP